MAKGILLGNLGTPQSPSTKDVRAYLKEFLMDPFVINLPKIWRWLLVHLIIAPFRAPKSAKAYQSVWMKEGSPLLVFSERLKVKLQTKMGPEYKISLGMRYGVPSIESALAELKDCESILLAPLYPQYAESSYQTWIVAALAAADQLGVRQKIKILDPFYQDENYLASQRQIIEENIKGKNVEHVLFSFHGLPESHLARPRPEIKASLPAGPVDSAPVHNCLSSHCVQEINAQNRWCYRASCFYVAREISQQMGLKPEEWSVSFQSRLAGEPWISPFTDVVIPRLAEKYMNLAVVMPAFTADCLETVEEIGIEAKEQFLTSGGKQFIAIPCLNDNSYWVDQLGQLLKKSI